MFNSFLLEIDSSVLLVSAAAILFAVQLFLLLKFKIKLVRLIPTALCLILAVAFFISVYIFDGWDSIGFLILAMYAAIFFAGLLAFYIIWSIIEVIIKRKTQDNKQEK